MLPYLPGVTAGGLCWSVVAGAGGRGLVQSGVRLRGPPDPGPVLRSWGGNDPRQVTEARR